MVQVQGGNEVDNTYGISTSCQRSRCAVIGRPATLVKLDIWQQQQVDIK
jgi:hypothetical protein